MGEPHGVAIVGLGVISRAYLETLAGHPDLRIVAVADLDAERARTTAAALPGTVALDVDGALSHPEVETVLNLTIPAAHAEIAHRAIDVGRNVYGEKPLAVTFEDAAAVVAHARARSVWLGAAPDTVLGTGVQTARDAVDRGLIGRPTTASAVWVSGGHEAWHPAPDFYYAEGGGPLLDMGPYYVAALVQLLGPVVAVSGATGRARATRTIATGSRAGGTVDVEVDTHVSALLTHEDGAVSTVTVSFDGHRSSAPPIEVQGEEGSLAVPDPNTFTGTVLMGSGAERRELPVSAGYVDAARGVGLVDAVRRGGDGRVGGDVALHVVEVMTSVLASAREGRTIALTTRPARPDLVPLTPAREWRRAG